eukprot:1141432-Pelagomonas_calceolata.AAC.8
MRMCKKRSICNLIIIKAGRFMGPLGSPGVSSCSLAQESCSSSRGIFTVCDTFYQSIRNCLIWMRGWRIATCTEQDRYLAYALH